MPSNESVCACFFFVLIVLVLTRDRFRIFCAACLPTPSERLPLLPRPRVVSARRCRHPTVPLQVPHAPSIPLLLLYVLGVCTNPSTLAETLLPLSIADRFPSAPEMARAMATHCEHKNSPLPGAHARAHDTTESFVLLTHNARSRATSRCFDRRGPSIGRLIFRQWPLPPSRSLLPPPPPLSLSPYIYGTVSPPPSPTPSTGRRVAL
jgi:hypothetical protein